MKRFNAQYLFLVALPVFFNSCNISSDCKEMKQNEVVLLLDVSDPRLYKEIEDDLTANFPGFMAKNGLGAITPCQSFTLSVAHLSGKEALDLSTANIGITRKGLSRTEQRRQASPAPLVNLLKKKIEEFWSLSNNPDMNQGSCISNVLLKSIIHLNPEAKGVILVFSDMVENNHSVNFYKHFPSAGDIPAITAKMIDPALFEQFRNYRDQGIDAKIIIVLKPEPAGKIQLREVKEFWAEFFKELKLEGQVQFIDNLTNPVEL